MTYSRKLMIGLSALMIAGSGVLPLGVNAAPAAQTEAVAAQFQAEQISTVHMRHSDMAYIPLFSSRQEDKPAIVQVASLMTRLMGKAKEDTSSLDSEQAFFSTKIDVTLKDGSFFNMLIADQKKVYFIYGGTDYSAEDSAAIQSLQKLLVVPDQTYFSTTKPQIGAAVRIKGNNAMSEKGTIRIFVGQGGMFSSVRAVNGISFPTKSALLVHEAPIVNGRYDFTFTMPAYGIDVNGSLKPLKPGKSWIFYDTGSLAGMKELTVLAPAKPILSINGKPVNDPALKPVVQNGIMLLPMRALADKLGWQAAWDSARKAALLGSPMPTGDQLSEAGGALSVWENGKRLTGTGSKPVLINSRLYLPLRAAAQAFGLQVEWTSSVRSANLTVPAQS
ncbi:copper amine oxidase N-terminal domain-containing protein [Paenibacillus montanisoli]|uniref:Copper amine oxidase-like N-terminal domain-containing protein n=1 Tax=Paenibacillus montanisoli TaxID=2081970 RepID=A0A328U298_9BACL|nr:copper amine oxidase N-terminal domain-containing protein [Paenibacillus montanisoli]RAP74124.1 hypothetical protein DL346_23935 [Paenibacillus montanisoli]